MDQKFLASLFSDGTANYVTPMEPKINETVRIRFRALSKKADGVYLICKGNVQKMDLKESAAGFDYFETNLLTGESAVSYFFEITAGSERCIYDRLGASFAKEPEKPFWIIPGFSTPGWTKGAVMYQIFTDRFCNGDPENDVLDNEYFYDGGPICRVKDWNEPPSAEGTRQFYGGDLKGVLQKLDYLKGLGVEVLYLNPIFVSPSNHKYDTQDYDAVDPHFGVIVTEKGSVLSPSAKDNREASLYISRVTDQQNLEASNAFFARLTKEIHRRGMRVILDGVFNHCGSFNKWLDRERIYEGLPGYQPGAYLTRESLYHSYFSFMDDNDWPCNDSYVCWWDFATLPKLNYEAAGQLEKKILEIAAKWVSAPYNADGWRLDVAADLGFSPEYNHSFWKKFRKVVKDANPDAVILAEHYGDASDWLKGDEWDTVMNYDAFMEPLTWFFTGEDKHSDVYSEELKGDAAAFETSMKLAMSAFPEPSLQSAMNELSNHDHSRFLTRTNGKPGRLKTLGSAAASKGVRPEVMREAVVMQMTWPGAPTVYYGDEAGVCGFTDPDSRRTYPWGREDEEMIRFYTRAIAMHKRFGLLKGGSLCFLSVFEEGGPDEDGSIRDCLAYARFDKKSALLILFNNSGEKKTLTVDVWPAGIGQERELTSVFSTDGTGFSEEKSKYEIINGRLCISLPATSSLVLQAI